MIILNCVRFFLSKLFLCKIWVMHVLLNLSLFEHEIPHKKYERFHVQIKNSYKKTNINLILF